MEKGSPFDSAQFRPQPSLLISHQSSPRCCLAEGAEFSVVVPVSHHETRTPPDTKEGPCATGRPAVPHTILLCSALGIVSSAWPCPLHLLGCHSNPVLLGAPGCGHCHRGAAAKLRAAREGRWAVITHSPCCSSVGNLAVPHPDRAGGSPRLSSLQGHSQTCPATPLVTGPSLGQEVRTSCGLFFRHSPVDANICCPRFWQPKSGCYQPNHVNCQHFSCPCLHQLQNNGKSCSKFLLSCANYCLLYCSHVSLCPLQ